MTDTARHGITAAALAAVALATPIALRAQRFEAEDVSGPAEAWVKDKESPTHWNLWSTDVDANKKWSGGIVLRSPFMKADRATPEEGAPPIHTVLKDLDAGIYTVQLKVGRVLGVSVDGNTWKRYTGGPVLSRQRVAQGGSIEFWVDDRYALEEETSRGPGYYDYVELFAHGKVADGIPNPGFEDVNAEGGAAEWTWWSREGGGQAVSVTDAIHGGAKAVRITHGGEKDWAFSNGTRLLAAGGTDLCVRAWMRGPVGGSPVSIDVAGYSDGQLVSWTVGQGRAAMTGEWVEAKGYFSVPRDVDELQVRFIGAGNSDVVIDDVSVVPEKVVWPTKPKVTGWATERVREPMGRGAVALPLPDGVVYLSWRLLAEDPDGIGFDVYRRVGDGDAARLNDEPIVRTTDFVDRDPPAGERGVYTIRPAKGFRGVPGDACWGEGDGDAPYVRVTLNDEKTLFQKVGVADLNGDGIYDYVIKQPHENIDPWVKYWYKSPETYKLEAYLHDGTFLWCIDLGWGIERGIWYSPYIVCDLTGDGKAEVAAKVGAGDPRDEDGRVTKGEEYVVVWDGMTGKEIARAPWLPRDAFGTYNYASRNQIAVAYLDGKTPCLLTLRGTYTRMMVHAYQLHDGRLEPLWEYDNEPYGRAYWGQGAHFTLSADVDNDGRDEVILGSAVLDDNGVPLWSTGRGHPDAAYLTDVTSANPGLELAYVMETRQRRDGGLNVVDAASGRQLWALNEPTRHVHGKGLCADIDATVPGMEVSGADADGHTLTDHRWLFSADGDLLRSGKDCPWGFGMSTVYWDADLQKEIVSGTISDFRGGPVSGGRYGSVRLTADVLGDWREEVIVSTAGELRIYCTPIPAMDRRVCLMQDPVYRRATAMNAMGYTQGPTLSYNPATRAPNMALTFLSTAAAQPSLQVVVSAPADRPVRGRLALSADPGIGLDPDTFEVDLKPGEQLLRTVLLVSDAAKRPQGLVRARLVADGLDLRGQVPVKLAGAFLTSGIMAQAEAFSAQEGGQVQIRDDKAGTMANAISHWDDKAHALTWEFTVPQEGAYHLVLRHCAPHAVSRKLTVDGKDIGLLALPNTGAFGNQPSDWEHTTAATDGKDITLRLGVGSHTVRLENTDGQGCNLDYLALVPADK